MINTAKWNCEIDYFIYQPHVYIVKIFADYETQADYFNSYERASKKASDSVNASVRISTCPFKYQLNCWTFNSITSSLKSSATPSTSAP